MVRNFSIILLCLAAHAATPDRATFKVIASLDKLGQPVGIVEGSPGLFYFKGGSGQQAIVSITPQGDQTVNSTFGVNEKVLAPVVSGANGRLYSAIEVGGDSAKVFSVDSSADSRRSYAALTLFPEMTRNLPYGKLLGVAFQLPGSTYDLVVCDLQGNVKPLFQFPAGEHLARSAIFATDGNYYGVALKPKTGAGYVYRVTPAGKMTKVVTFPAGSFPKSYAYVPFLEARDGNLYGSTTAGGANGMGTIYKLTLSGQFTTLHTFSKGPDSHPGALIQASDGALYGATYGDGGATVLFRISKTGNYSSVYEMRPASDGQCQCHLTQGSDGIIYGTAFSHGAKNNGTIFALDAALPLPSPRPRQFRPQSGAAGAKVLIWGYDMLSPSVAFNGVAATEITSAGSNYVWATVPAGATSGPITITTPGGSRSTKGSFTVQ